MSGESVHFDQDQRWLKIESTLPANGVVLTSLTGKDAVSAPFGYTISITTTAADALVLKLLGQSVTLWLSQNIAGDRRPINGRVRRLGGPTPGTRGLRTWVADIVPALSFLDFTADIRIFQTMSVPDIIKKIFSDHGLTDYELRNLMGTYPTLDYCVQYRETAFNFVSRLMEHVGLFYWHEHRDGGHKLVIADYNNMATPALPQPAKDSTQTQSPDVDIVVSDYAFRTGKWALTDYDFEVPSKSLATQEPTVITEPAMTQYEVYDYPGLYTDKSNGTALTRVRIEHEEAQFSRISGTGYRALFDAGKILELQPAAGAPAGGQDKFLLVQVQHTATDPAPTAGTATGWTYQNTFVGVPLDKTFRPDRITPKPFVHGLQTAVVTGPAGEKIYTDQYGRVKVKFFWDRNPDGKASENSSCWLRVSQAWADNAWGAIHIPRLGEEVIVDFLEGDPDRPIITGRVYNGTNKVPYELPANKTQSGIKSQSVPGSGSNEFRFEDKLASEEVYLHAQKDFNVSVEHDESDVIGRNRTVSVGANDRRTVGGDAHDKIVGSETYNVIQNITETVGGNVTRTVAGNVNDTIGTNLTQTVGGSVTENYVGALTQTVAGGISIVTPLTMTIMAVGGYSQIAPTSAWQTGPTSLSAYGFAFGAFGANTQIAGFNGQVFLAQLQAVAANIALNGFSSTVIGVELNKSVMETKTTVTKMENSGIRILTAISHLFA